MTHWLPTGETEFEDEALSITNAFRKIHRALPIKLSPEMSRQAKQYAERIASMGSLQHDYAAVKQLDEGENLVMGCKQIGVPLTAKEAITNWQERTFLFLSYCKSPLRIVP